MTTDADERDEEAVAEALDALLRRVDPVPTDAIQAAKDLCPPPVIDLRDAGDA